MILGRTGFARKGEWIAAVTYDALDIVTHEGKVYIGRRESVGSEPSSESNDWVMLPGAPSFEIEETASGYDLTITGSDGTSETISILNGEVDREELEDALEAFRSSTDAYFAPDYDDTATYFIGDNCIYEGRLYRCIEDIPTAEPWTAEHWEPVVLTDKLTQMWKDAEVKADVVVSSAEPGDIVVIADGADNIPVKELVVGIEPIQDGEPWIDSEYDKVPYTFRPVSDASVSRIGNREMDKLIGGTVAWNQLFPYRTTTFSGTGWNLKGNGDGTLTITVTDETASSSSTNTNPTALSAGVMALNHKYLWLSGNSLIHVDIKSMAIHTDTIFNCTNAGYSNIAIVFTNLPQGTYTIKPMLIDLTQMFGSTIADYIYTLESGTAGSGIAKLKEWGFLQKDYYPYNSGALMSVQTSAHVMRDADDNVIGNYPLDSSLVLRGILRLDANNSLYYDGDVYKWDGSVARRYGIVDLGTLNWTYVSSDTVFYATISDKRDALAAIRCGSRYMPGGLTGYSTPDYLIGQSSNASLVKRIFISDPTYTTASDFKASLSGVYLVYELATETTESADPFAQYQIVDADGTEEYVDERTVPIPVGHESNYAYYSPISGWTGVEVYHSGEDTSDPTTIPISWQSAAGTVYGGSLDLTSGVLTSILAYDQMTYSYLSGLSSSYIGYVQTTFGGVLKNAVWVRNWNYQTAKVRQAGGIMAYCNAFPIYMHDTNTFSSQNRTYFDIGTMTSVESFLASVNALEQGGSGLFIAYELATPLVFQLTPTQIRSLFGTNVFWSDANGGIQSLRYVSDLKLYLEQLTKPTEDDMIANSNIPANTYFNVGNVLYLSTAAIAAGEKIEPDTNCTRKSLADALNDLHD